MFRAKGLGMESRMDRYMEYITKTGGLQGHIGFRADLLAGIGFGVQGLGLRGRKKEETTTLLA